MEPCKGNSRNRKLIPVSIKVSFDYGIAGKASEVSRSNQHSGRCDYGCIEYKLALVAHATAGRAAL